MKFSKFLLLALCVLFAACSKNGGGGDDGGEGKGGDDVTAQAPTKANITDAKALYLAESTSVTRAENGGGERKLFKITENGMTSEVTFTDESGENIKINVVQLFKISDNFIMMLGYIISEPDPNSNDVYIEESTLHGWLVRKSDGAVFDLDNTASEFVANLLIKPSTMMVDRSGNIYWMGLRGGITLKGPIYKMSPNGDDNLTAVPISGDYNWIGWCYMDDQDVILMETEEGWVCRFPDGTFSHEIGINVINSFGGAYTLGIFCMPIKESADGGFIIFEEFDNGWKTRIIKLSINIVDKSIDRTEITTLDYDLRDYERDDMPDGSYVLYSYDYKNYIYVSPSGEVTTETFETGFPYGNRRVSNNFVYGLGNSTTIYRMDLETRETEQVFSDSRYKIDDYQVAPDDSYVDIFAMRYVDARKVVLRVRDGNIVSENTQSAGTGDVLTFIRLN